MKKSLLALAALTAFAGAASAQSSVTLFGVLDLSARYVEYGDTGQYQLATDGNASSRLGFRGVEDLGGGLKAGFWLEGAVAADNGQASGQTWQRRATVSLMGGWGEVRLGRDYTPTFWNWTVFDPFGTVGVGAATNLGLEVAGLAPGGSYGTLVRADNTFGYFLPAMGGFYGQVMQSLAEGPANGNKITALRLGYSAGPINVAGSWGTTEVANNVDGDTWNLGGSWNFGFMSLRGFYGEIEVNTLKQKNWYVAATVPIGAFTLKGSYGEVDRSGNAGAATCPTTGSVSGTCVAIGDASQIALGFTYDLSKRTALYGTYAQTENNGTRFRNGSIANSGTIYNTLGKDTMGYEFGVRHSF